MNLKIFSEYNKKIMVKINAIPIAIRIEWKQDTSAFLISLPPIALPTEEVTPPPIAPAAIINISIWKGKIIIFTSTMLLFPFSNRFNKRAWISVGPKQRI